MPKSNRPPFDSDLEAASGSDPLERYAALRASLRTRMPAFRNMNRMSLGIKRDAYDPP
jgi:hypothetical protein